MVYGIAAAMDPNINDKDEHENDVVMPGFRFHPTEEELIEFYLRRKVQGKRFNVELIAFLDLYRYDPWELPALAAIGENEWYFYVPRDRKYRNGDRPNRVTTSGYWKATGADRMIRTDSFRAIGLKKTLVFYAGKAPKGIRTSWIMNEYRLPQQETNQYQKVELSLCRVYKRSGVEDSPLLNSLSSKPSSSRGVEPNKKRNMDPQEIAGSSQSSLRELSSSSVLEKFLEGSSISTNYTGDADLSLQSISRAYSAFTPVAPIGSSSMELVGNLSPNPKQLGPSLPTCSIFPPSSLPMIAVDELHRLVDYQHIISQQNAQIFPSPASQPLSLPLNTVPISLQTFSDKLWEWNPIPDASRDYNAFK